MDEKEALEEIDSCVECKECLKVCDTYQLTENDLQSPYGRLKIAKKVLNAKEISEDERLGLYSCTFCGLCDLACTQEIRITEVIHLAKAKLSETKKGVYDIQNTIINGILEKDNSVNGEPKERLDWLPEESRKTERFDEKESDTLLFLGCMSSFKVKESANTAYRLLKQADYDFKILKNEPCCGEYIYSAGNIEEAKKYFEKTYGILKKNHIKTIIVTCAGCLYAFNNVYPKYFDDWDIEVRHIVQVLYELEQKGKLKFKDLNQNITLHDACRMGRKIKGMDIYKEPRELLAKTNAVINELSHVKENSHCCGAGSGVRGINKKLCIKIGSQILDEMNTEVLISSCPLCVFNFRYVNYKTEDNKKFQYITDFLLSAVEDV
ncbi:MAG: (Fe-S)-binding protein [Promethearchaeia archaeon]